MLALIQRKSDCINNRVDFTAKIISKDKEGHFIKTKGAMHQLDITILNAYAPNWHRMKIF